MKISPNEFSGLYQLANRLLEILNRFWRLIHYYFANDYLGFPGLSDL